MKRLLFIIFAFLGMTTLKAQTVNGVPLNEIESIYIEVIAHPKTMSNRVIVEIDFGQVNKYWKAKDAVIVDEMGNTITFNSALDALNYMAKFGYEYLDTYVVTDSNGYSSNHFILKRKHKIPTDP